jgi:hypothetical protein
MTEFCISLCLDRARTSQASADNQLPAPPVSNDSSALPAGSQSLAPPALIDPSGVPAGSESHKGWPGNDPAHDSPRHRDIPPQPPQPGGPDPRDPSNNGLGQSRVGPDPDRTDRPDRAAVMEADVSAADSSPGIQPALDYLPGISIAQTFPALTSVHFSAEGSNKSLLVGDEGFDANAYAAYQQLFDVPGAALHVV